jgi:Hydrazine synthase alpha subunit middle domain
VQPNGIRIKRIAFFALVAIVVPGNGALGATAPGHVAKRDASLSYVFTSTPQYEAKAWVDGRDRFPLGAKLVAVEGGIVRLLAPGFFGAADAAVSYDTERVLFSGKRTAGDHWQIWEVDLQGGTPRQITHCDSDCVSPLYLPGAGFVFSRGDGLEITEVGGKTRRITFAPGRYLTDDVLHDGRILFEISRGDGKSELFTVYPDGTGVESLRCDHGPDRGGARQLASGDSIFVANSRLTRITSAMAHQVDLPQPEREPTGPIAEISPGNWLISLKKNGHWGLFLWNSAARHAEPLETPADASAVQPATIAARTPPRQFPSALVPTRTAGNLLCLNARESRTGIDGASVHSVRAYSPAGLLGQTEVERDGSFYIQVPPDRPIRLELVNAAGQVIQAERNWFWMRPAEQRICVGCHLGPERAPENKVPDILLKTILPVKMLEVQAP